MCRTKPKRRAPLLSLPGYLCASGCSWTLAERGGEVCVGSWTGRRNSRMCLGVVAEFGTQPPSSSGQPQASAGASKRAAGSSGRRTGRPRGPEPPAFPVLFV